MKKHLLYWMKGKIWRFPLSLSLFLLPPAIYASEVQMEAVKPISIQLTDVSLSEAMSQIEKVSGCSFFYDANNDGFGDFKGLSQKINYFQYLNIDAILLPDIFNQEEIIAKDVQISIYDKYGNLKQLNSYSFCHK